MVRLGALSVEQLREIDPFLVYDDPAAQSVASGTSETLEEVVDASATGDSMVGTVDETLLATQDEATPDAVVEPVAADREESQDDQPGA